MATTKATPPPSTMICKACGHELPFGVFRINRKCRWGRERMRRPCQSDHASLWLKTNPGKNAEHGRAFRRNSTAKYMVGNAKMRAKLKGLPFGITASDIVIPDACPILGIPLVIGAGHHTANSPSIDRVVPSLGYVKGNFQIISLRANIMKSDASIKELLDFALWVNRTFGVAA